MTSLSETIRHYQRSIDRSVKDEARLLHCLDKLNKLPINMKYLRATRVGRTVNNLKKHDGIVGQTATELVAKWKREVEAVNAESNDKNERQHKNDTENIEPSTRNICTVSQENGTSSTPSDSRDQTVNKSSPVSYSTDNSITSKSICSGKSPQEKCSQLGKKSSKNCDEKTSKLHRSHSSISRSSAKGESDSSVWSDCSVITNNSKRKDCGKTSDRKRERESNLIDIDCTMGTSFGEALGMLDVPSTSKVKRLHIDKSSLLSKASISSRHAKFGLCSPLDETPILLTKRPQLQPPPLDIDVEILSPSTVTETLECAFRNSKPRKQTTQLTDDVTTNIISRTAKTKVFSGNKIGSKCKVPTLFELCIRLLQDNIDLLECIGGVPVDILRPVLERTTCEQLMTLEDYNPYLLEETNWLWEQHCKRRFRTRSREELETWREMYIRCLDEERAKFESLTATIKLSNERKTKPTYVDTTATKITKANQMMSLGCGTLSHAGGNRSSVDDSGTKSKDSNQIRKRSRKSNDDPDWTPTTWYKTLYKKVREPKPPKPPIKKTIDMLRYDRAKELEKKKGKWK